MSINKEKKMQKLNYELIKNKIDELKSSIEDCNVQMLYIYGYSCDKNKFSNLFLKFEPETQNISNVIKVFNQNKKKYKYISIGVHKMFCMNKIKKGRSICYIFVVALNVILFFIAIPFIVISFPYFPIVVEATG